MPENKRGKSDIARYLYHPVSTGRMELVPATLDILISDRDDRQTLSRLLNATIPASWPPPLIDHRTLDEFINIVSSSLDPFFCTWYWIRKGTVQGDRVLLGSGGIASDQVSSGCVVLGYSVLSQFQNQGYATEAVCFMLPVIFSLPGICEVVATTYPDLVASIRVLEKNGFSPSCGRNTGVGIREGTLVYSRKKPDLNECNRDSGFI